MWWYKSKARDGTGGQASGSAGNVVVLGPGQGGAGQIARATDQALGGVLT